MQWPWSKANTGLDREVAYHLETLADAYERQGMSRKEAMRRARVDFGGVDQVKEACREESRWNWLTHFAQDMRFGWRMMRKSPSISISAVLSLALGIGATTAILSLADAVLWRSLPVPEPEYLSEVLWQAPGRVEIFKGSSGSMHLDDGVRVANFFSPSAAEAMRARVAGKAELGVYVYGGAVSISYRGNAAVTRLRGVSGNFLSMLRVQPHAGRLLNENDDSPSAPSAAVVTYRFFRRYLGEDHSSIGQILRVNNHPYVIAGVLSHDFGGLAPGDDSDLYTPVQHSPDLLNPEGWSRRNADNPLAWWQHLMVRRSPQTTEEELRSLLDAAFASTWRVQPKTKESTPRVRLANASKGLGNVRRRMGDPVLILLGLVTLVLLVACANIANLLLARAVHREKEVALRVSLGCAQGRLLRQFFTESLMLALMGGALSLGVAAGVGTLMVNLMPGSDGMSLPNELTLRSVAGTVLVTMLTALLFGLYPAWRASRLDASPALKEGSGSGGTVSRARWLPAKTLVAAQVSLGVLLVTSAILYTGHLSDLVNRDTGFERDNILLFDVRPGEMGYKKEKLKQFYLELEDRLSTLQGIASVGICITRPMLGGGYWDDLQKPGDTRWVSSAVHHGNPEFLTAMGVEVLAGRMLTAQEARSDAKVILLSEDLAKQLDLVNPLGRRVKMSNETYEVIGITKSARYSHMNRQPPIAYAPFAYDRDAVTIVLRTTQSPRVMLSAARQAVRELSPDLPLVDVFTMEQQISRVLQRERLFAWLCGSFGVLALVLCVVGLYGLMSHTTARRTPEIGIRIALGASSRVVLRQVVGEGMKLACAGLLLGVPAALYVSHIAQKQKLLPDGEMPYWTLAAAIAVLTVSALAAVVGPAWRASTVDPMQALRRG
ncbi:MAG: ABC transporter permease [Bryobacterales bacterium]|nr:ABC transporter permease [Bryobacterales bacterium]